MNFFFHSFKTFYCRNYLLKKRNVAPIAIFALVSQSAKYSFFSRSKNSRNRSQLSVSQFSYWSYFCTQSQPLIFHFCRLIFLQRRNLFFFLLVLLPFGLLFFPASFHFPFVGLANLALENIKAYCYRISTIPYNLVIFRFRFFLGAFMDFLLDEFESEDF